MSEVEFRWLRSHWLNTVFLQRVRSRTHLDQPAWLACLNPFSRETKDGPKLLCPVLHAFGGPNSSLSGTLVQPGVVVSPKRACPTGLSMSLPMLIRWVIVQFYLVQSATLQGTYYGLPWGECLWSPVASWASPGTFSRICRPNVPTPHSLAVVLRPESSVPTHWRFEARFMAFLSFSPWSTASGGQQRWNRMESYEYNYSSINPE